MKAGPKKLSAATAAVVLMLAGCGQREDDAAADGAVPAAALRWAADACRTLPAEAAGMAAGLAVTTANSAPGAVVGGTRVSTCSYATADGVLFTVALRQSAESSEAIAGLNANPDMTGPIEEIAAPAGRAFWTPGLKTLSYLPDDTRMVTVTPPGVRVMGGPNDPDDALKQKALTIALAAASGEYGP